MDFDIRHDDPLVSISVITYNHEPYIRECLDSLLMQETDFPFEICIGEDESKDGTREICVEYAEKHPDRIRLFLRSQSEPVRKAYTAQYIYNGIETAEACRGKYIALCEGDDKWIDPLKLQKQVGLMEADTSLVLVHSDFDRVDLVSGQYARSINKSCCVQHNVNPDKSTFIYDVLQLHYPITTCTVCMRASALHDIYTKHRDLFKQLAMSDIPRWCELANYGTFHYMDEPLGLYRVLRESVSNTQSPARRYKFVNAASNLGLLFGERHGLPMDKVRANKVKNCNRYALLSGDFEEINRLRADKNFPFKPAESAIYLACKTKPTRAIAKWLFVMRYERNRSKHL